MSKADVIKLFVGIFAAALVAGIVTFYNDHVQMQRDIEWMKGQMLMQEWVPNAVDIERCSHLRELIDAHEKAEHGNG